MVHSNFGGRDGGIQVDHWSTISSFDWFGLSLLLIALTHWGWAKMADIQCSWKSLDTDISDGHILIDPDMHHGTCVTHVTWCMPGSKFLTTNFTNVWWTMKVFSATLDILQADIIFKCIFFNDNCCWLIKISATYVTKGSINNNPAFV